MHRDGRFFSMKNWRAMAVLLTAGLVTATAQTAATTLQKAAAALQAGQWAACRALATQALAADPKSGDAEMLLGLADTAEQRFAEAQRRFQRAAVLQPNNYRVHAYLGSTLLQLGQRAEAGKAFEKVLALSPGNATAHFNLGVMALERSDAAAGARHFAAVVAVNANDVDSLLGLLDCQLRLRQITAAGATARRLAAAVDGAHPALERAAALLTSHEANSGALPILERIYAASPRSEDAAYNLALASLEARRWERAAAVLRASPGAKAETWNLLGRAEDKRHQPAAAFAAYRRATELDPSSEAYEFDYLCALINSGDLEAARLRADDAVSHFPRSSGVRLGSGVAAYLAGRYDEAAEAFLQAVDLSPNNPAAYYLLGRTYESAGRQQTAIAEAFVQYLVKDPADAWAHLHYARLLRLQANAAAPDASAASRHLARAIALNPALGEAYLERAIVSQAAQRYADSVKDLNLAAARMPASADVQYRLGIAHQRTGDKALAEGAFARFRQLKAESEAASRREVLNSLTGNSPARAASGAPGRTVVP